MINVFLRRQDASGQQPAIQRGVRTWVVIHGRDSESGKVQSLAKKLDNVGVEDQVLLLDWSDGAGDNFPVVGLDGGAWIEPVATWATNTLMGLGISADELLLVGHSWGSFVAYEIAVKIPGKVRGLVALDPALEALGYPQSTVDFDAEATWSWAFYGDDSLFGSAALAKTAHESFLVEFNATPGMEPSSLERHIAPVRTFEALVARNSLANPPLRSDVFSLGRLLDAQAGPWIPNQYRDSIFGEYYLEAVIRVRDLNSDGLFADSWDEIESVRYYDKVTNVQVTW